MNTLNWCCKPYPELSPDELYALLRLRCEVFIVEQDCAYLDPDGTDQAALHMMGLKAGRLVAGARLIPPGIQYDSCSIGRVVTSASVRGQGYGQQLMQQAIHHCRTRWPGQVITISAQHYLAGFYRSLGFATESEPYMEDGIVHVRMCLPA